MTHAADRLGPDVSDAPARAAPVRLSMPPNPEPA